MQQLLDNKEFLALVASAIAFLGGKLFGWLDKRSDGKLTAALGTARSVMQNYVLTARPDVTVEELTRDLLGIARIQLANLFGSAKLPPEVQTLVDGLVHEFLGMWLSRHADPESHRDAVQKLAISGVAAKVASPK